MTTQTPQLHIPQRLPDRLSPAELAAYLQEAVEQIALWDRREVVCRRAGEPGPAQDAYAMMTRWVRREHEIVRRQEAGR